MPSRLRPVILALTAAAAVLAGCAQQGPEAPTDQGVCWLMNTGKDGKPKFDKVASNVRSLEYCAGNLEALRLKFLGMGGSRRTLTGAYQGQFIFVEREGIFSATGLERNRYLALVRTNDGRLVVPGTNSQEQ